MLSLVHPLLIAHYSQKCSGISGLGAFNPSSSLSICTDQVETEMVQFTPFGVCTASYPPLVSNDGLFYILWLN